MSSRVCTTAPLCVLQSLGVRKDSPAKPHTPALLRVVSQGGTWALDTPIEPPDSLGAGCAHGRGAHRGRLVCGLGPELCSVSRRWESFPDGSFGSLANAAPAASRLLPVIHLLLSHR